MIRPEKYMDLDNSVIRVSAYILRYIKKRKTIKYDNLYKNLSKAFDQESLKYSFIPALSFLYLLDLIIYNQDLDTIDFHETVKAVRGRRQLQKH